MIIWKQEAYTQSAHCSSDVWEDKHWWFRNKASINILRMKNDAETILKSRVALVTSLYCSWNDSTNMCRAWNPQHATERCCCVYVAKLLQTHYKLFTITCVLYCECYTHMVKQWQWYQKEQNVVTINVFKSHHFQKWTKYLWIGFHIQTTGLKFLSWNLGIHEW